MQKVIIESPYAGDVERNIAYARACLKDSLLRGEAPFASHLLYTQEGVLNDNNKTERELGINAGFSWHECADFTVVYTDLGISHGMVEGINNALTLNKHVEYRTLGKEARKEFMERDQTCD